MFKRMGRTACAGAAAALVGACGAAQVESLRMRSVAIEIVVFATPPRKHRGLKHRRMSANALPATGRR